MINILPEGDVSILTFRDFYVKLIDFPRKMMSSFSSFLGFYVKLIDFSPNLMKS